MESDTQQILNKCEQKVLLLLSSPVDGLWVTVAVGLMKPPTYKQEALDEPQHPGP